VTCERLSQSDDQGRVRIVPSVQLVVAADRVHRAQPTKDKKPLMAVADRVARPRATDERPMMLTAEAEGSPCMPLPRSRDVTGSTQALEIQRCLTALIERGMQSDAAQKACTHIEQICKSADGENERLCKARQVDVRGTYWNRVKGALSYGENLPDLPPSGSTGNRIIFRLPADAVDRISVLDVGVPGSARPVHLERMFQDRIVIVGQTYAESADFFDTPVGRMPGAILLINAIDSMNRHGVARSMPGWVAVPAVTLFIAVVAYCFARWNSATGTFMATLVIILLAGLASFAFWARGGWLNFVAPLIGIQVHSWWARYEERRELEHVIARVGGYDD
jgi:CHASE2 domain-containing protein